MDFGATQFSDLLPACVALIGVLLTIGIIISFRSALASFLRWLSAAFNSDAQTARESGAEFSAAFNDLREQTQRLELCVGNYYSIFDKAGWPGLLTEFEALAEAERAIQLFIQDGRYDDAVGLSGLLLDQFPDDLAELATQRFTDFAPLRGWKERARNVLMLIVDNTQIATEANREIGVQRSRDRKPTLETLAELRRWLDEK